MLPMKSYIIIKPTLNIELNPDISNLEKRLFWKKSTLIVAMSQTMLFAQQ